MLISPTGAGHRLNLAQSFGAGGRNTQFNRRKRRYFMADVLSRRPTDFVEDEMERMMRRFFGRPLFGGSG
jgi:hypothetical protein